MPTRRKRRKIVAEANGITVLDLGEMDIWDGADLALIRDTLIRLITRENKRKIAVDMTHVKYVPSGFFGMLYDWTERGVSIFLYRPQPRIKVMLWFQHFVAEVDGDGVYKIMTEHQMPLAPEGEPGFREPEWEPDENDPVFFGGSATPR
ncbi:MAG: STAS domain-containing protein [Planctomycetota bacterium]